jgi:GNAT superfamily N-acetyltransferase
MTELRAATAFETQTWREDWSRRLHAWYAKAGGPAAWGTQQVEDRMSRQSGGDTAHVLTVVDGGLAIGTVAVWVFEESGHQNVMLSDLCIAAPYRRRGYGRQALRLAEDWSRAQGGVRVMWLVTDPAESAHSCLFGGYPVRAQQMISDLSSAAGLAAGLTGRPMTEAEFAGWRAKVADEYATEIADSGSAAPEEAARASAEQFDQTLPDGLDTENHTFLCLEAGGEVVATNWICHHRWPGVSWVYGVEVGERHRGQGYGRAAMVIGEQATRQAGDTHLALNVFGHNTVAISMYEAMGYRAYDQGRSADL